MPSGVTSADFFYLLPQLVLASGSLLLLVVDVLLPRRWESALAWVALAVLGGTAAALLVTDGAHVTVARGLVAVDGFGFLFNVLFVFAAAVTVAMSPRYLTVEGVRPGEYDFLVLSATLGMTFMAGGIDSHHPLHRPRDDGRVFLHPRRVTSAPTGARTRRG